MPRPHLRGLPYFAGALALGGALLAGTAGPTPGAAAGDAVNITGLAFAAPSITVPEGTAVIWTNSDPVPHTVTSNTGAFDSGLLNPNQTFSFTFATAGTYSYFCDVHPTMLGTVIVTSAGAAPPAGEKPPEGQPPAEQEAPTEAPVDRADYAN